MTNLDLKKKAMLFALLDCIDIEQLRHYLRFFTKEYNNSEEEGISSVLDILETLLYIKEQTRIPNKEKTT